MTGMKPAIFINLFISYKTFKYLYLCLFTP